MTHDQTFALITGATQGIGYELAKLLAQDKYNLIMVARSEEDLAQRANELSQQYGITVVPIAKDLFKRESPFELYNAVKAQGIQVDVLVNNAGQGQYGEFVDTDIHRELDLIQLNVAAYTVLTKCFLKEMVARNDGKILNVSSIAGELPGPWQAVYHGTKAYVTSFTEAIRAENKDTAVTITLLEPGLTDTDFFNKANMQGSKLVQEHALADPAKVAKDGYEALMAGKDKVVSGFKNKVMAAAGNLMADRMVAAQMNKQAAPVDSASPKRAEG